MAKTESDDIALLWVDCDDMTIIRRSDKRY